MQLGFHYHIPAMQNTEGLYMPGYLGRFVDALAARCDQVVCFQHRPRPDEVKLLDYAIRSPNVRYVDLGAHASVPIRSLFAGRFVRPIREAATQLDAMVLRGPSPLIPSIVRILRGLPTVLYLVGNLAPRINHLPQPRWRKELIRGWVRWYNHRQRRAARMCLPLVISQQLYNEFVEVVPQTRMVSAASIDVDDFYERDDTCGGGAPFHLLYTGRITPFKGVFEIVEAVRYLADQDVDVMLDLVGWANEDDGTIPRLHDLAEALGVAQRVRFHGLKPFGPELFRYYREADVYVVAPRHNEGGPRTIWEALAFSLPVVSTRVGGIPDQLDDRQTARLTPPQNSRELARAIRDVLEDGVLRRRIIRNGHELARSHTLDHLADEMIAEIKEWVRRD